MTIPFKIKSLLDEKSSMFEPVLWQDNMPYDDIHFSMKNISNLDQLLTNNSSVKTAANLFSRILSPEHKNTAVLIQNPENIHYCIELQKAGYQVTGIDISPYLVDYLNRHRTFYSKHSEGIQFICRDIRNEALNLKVGSLMILNNVICDFPQWDMDNIISSIKNSLFSNGSVLIELIQKTLCDAVFYYFEDEKVSPWYKNKCYVKYEIINFFKENAYLEKYTVYNIDRDLIGFFSHSNTIYTFNSLKRLFIKHGFHPARIMIGWAGKPKNHHLILLRNDTDSKKPDR